MVSQEEFDAVVKKMEALTKRCEALEDAIANKMPVVAVPTPKKGKKFEDRDFKAHYIRMCFLVRKVSKSSIKETDIPDLEKYATDIAGIDNSGKAFQKRVIKAYNHSQAGDTDSEPKTTFAQVLDALRDDADADD